MKKLNYQIALQNYLNFLKKIICSIIKKIFYENNIEKLSNWTNTNFKKIFYGIKN